VNANHVLLAIFKKKVSIVLKVILERQLAKKRLNVFSFVISKVFGEKYLFKKNVEQQK
jgi:hypothetical protein